MNNIDDYLQDLSTCHVQQGKLLLNDQYFLFTDSKAAQLLLDPFSLQIVRMNEMARRQYVSVNDQHTLGIALVADNPEWQIWLTEWPFDDKGQIRSFRAHRQLRGGQSQPVEVIGKPVYYNGKLNLLLTILEVPGVAAEVHDYVLTLKRHESLYRADTTALLVFEIRESWEFIRCLDVDEQAEQIFELNRLEFLAMNDTLLLSLVDRSMQHDILNALKKRSFMRFTHVKVRRDNSQVTLEVYLKLFRIRDTFQILCIVRELPKQDLLTQPEIPMDNLMANLMKNSRDALLILDRYRKVIALNNPAKKLFGITDEVVGSPVIDLFGSYSRDDLAQNIQMTELYGFLSERMIQEVQGGHLQYLHVMSSRIDLTNGDYLIALIYDEDTNSLESLNTNAIFASVFMNDSDGIIIFDEQKKVVWCNHAFTRMTGHQVTALAGGLLTVDDLFVSRVSHERSISAILDEQESWKGEVTGYLSDGMGRTFYLSLLLAEEERLQSRYYLGVVGELAHQERIRTNFESLMYVDSLTRLHNRLYQEQQLLQMIKHDQPFVMLFLDIDRFKQANDLYGYDAGDQLLIEIGRLLLAHFGDQVVSRLSGDDFAILCIVPMMEVRLRLEKLFQDFNKWSDQNNYFFLALSVGIARFPDDARTVRDILRCASQAVHLSKKQTGNSYTQYAPEIGATYLSGIQEEEALGHALKQGEIYLAYQPIVRNSDQRIVGFEALMRWNSKRFGLVPPSHFIPIAERTGVILDLGRQTIQQCRRDLPLFQSVFGEKTFLSMNISLVQLMDGHAVEEIVRNLGRMGANAGHFIIEITETQYVENYSHLRDVIKRFRNYGIRVAIDDFGTGYSSLNKLIDLDIDMIKVDQSFTRDIETKPRSQALLKVITSMAEVFHFDLLIEGVENEQQMGYIDQNRVKYIQGYLYGRPQKIDYWLKDNGGQSDHSML
ncbi:MAG: EAL domain-containing protein [Clostridiaceae bacterium]|nr:EAL domain-containing protein [Clostridiaceae bacterium]